MIRLEATRGTGAVAIEHGRGAPSALARLDPLWDELFPGEQERIVRLLVERVDITDAGAEIRLNLEGLAGLARDMGAKREAMAA